MGFAKLLVLGATGIAVTDVEASSCFPLGDIGRSFSRSFSGFPALWGNTRSLGAPPAGGNQLEVPAGGQPTAEQQLRSSDHEEEVAATPEAPTQEADPTQPQVRGFFYNRDEEVDEEAKAAREAEKAEQQKTQGAKEGTAETPEPFAVKPDDDADSDQGTVDASVEHGTANVSTDSTPKTSFQFQPSVGTWYHRFVQEVNAPAEDGAAMQATRQTESPSAPAAEESAEVNASVEKNTPMEAARTYVPQLYRNIARQTKDGTVEDAEVMRPDDYSADGQVSSFYAEQLSYLQALTAQAQRVDASVENGAEMQAARQTEGPSAPAAEESAEDDAVGDAEKTEEQKVMPDLFRQIYYADKPTDIISQALLAQQRRSHQQALLAQAQRKFAERAATGVMSAPVPLLALEDDPARGIAALPEQVVSAPEDQREKMVAEPVTTEVPSEVATEMGTFDAQDWSLANNNRIKFGILYVPTTIECQQQSSAGNEDQDENPCSVVDPTEVPENLEDDAAAPVDGTTNAAPSSEDVATDDRLIHDCATPFPTDEDLTRVEGAGDEACEPSETGERHGAPGAESQLDADNANDNAETIYVPTLIRTDNADDNAADIEGADNADDNADTEGADNADDNVDTEGADNADDNADTESADNADDNADTNADDNADNADGRTGSKPQSPANVDPQPVDPANVDEGLSPGAIAAIVICPLVGLALVAVIVVFVVRGKKSSAKASEKADYAGDFSAEEEDTTSLMADIEDGAGEENV